MGAQQTKDRVIPAGSTVRQTRKQPRNLKDTRIIGSNIFTEHSGEGTHVIVHLPLCLGRGALVYSPLRVPLRHSSSTTSRGTDMLSLRLACLT